jgi:hypothetical protein
VGRRALRITWATKANVNVSTIALRIEFLSVVAALCRITRHDRHSVRNPWGTRQSKRIWSVAGARWLAVSGAADIHRYPRGAREDGVLVRLSLDDCSLMWNAASGPSIRDSTTQLWRRPGTLVITGSACGTLGQRRQPLARIHLLNGHIPWPVAHIAVPSPSLESWQGVASVSAHPPSHIDREVEFGHVPALWVRYRADRAIRRRFGACCAVDAQEPS